MSTPLMAAKTPFGVVKPDNMRTPRTAPPPTTTRRDPDEPTATAPVPGPTDPTPDPTPTTPDAPAPVPPVSPREVAPRPAAGDGTLADVLTAPNAHAGNDSVAALTALAGMRRRPVDPMNDWAGNGTRKPRWLTAAISQYAMLTGRKAQEVERDALLGTHPIPDDVLDANWLDLYGFPRAAYDPREYR